MQDITLQDEVTAKSTPSNDPLLGQKVPDFAIQATDGFEVHLQKLQGYQALLYFYPQNGLPGVTQLMKDLTAQYNGFKEIKTCVFGVSHEPLANNQAFKNSVKLPFPLLADENSKLANWFQTLTEKSSFGEPIQSLEQSTFLLDSSGTVAKVWRNPEIKGHALETMEAAHRLAQGLTETSLLEEDPSDALGKGQEKLAADLAEIFEI